MKTNYSMGATESKIDVRDFVYIPSKANWKGGTRYSEEYIEHQHKVGICTAAAIVQQFQKVYNKNNNG